MADALYIDASGLKKGSASLKQLIAKFPDRISDVLQESSQAVAFKAKRNAPANEGLLGGSIAPDNSKQLEKRVTVNAPYAAYIEFGTGAYGAQYISTLPEQYQSFAQQFKGSTGKSFKEFLRVLTEWVRLKGIAGTYSVKTHKRTGNKANQQMQNEQLAYVIARSILKHGVHPHPFLIPALIEQQPVLIRDLQNLLKQMKLN
jgi:hypothetical protein